MAATSTPVRSWFGHRARCYKARDPPEASLIQFPPELVMGIPDVDEYHVALYDQVNQLRAAMRSGDRAEAGRMLQFLETYAADHFAAEERCMEAAGYPDLAEHRKRHEEFARDLTARRAKLGSELATPRLLVDLSSWLADWLTDHIRGVDAEMARYLKEHPPAR